MVHLNKNKIFQYINDTLPEQEQLPADIHISTCTKCMEQIQLLFYIRKHFDLLWDSCTASHHAAIYQQLKMVTALNEVAKKSPTLAKKASKWFMNVSKNIGVNIKILLDRTQKVAAMASSFIPEGYTFNIEPTLAGVGSAKDHVKLEGHRKKSSEFLLQGQTKKAKNELLKAAKINARLTQSVISEINHGKEGAKTKIYADSRRGNVSVKHWPKKDKSSLEFVILSVSGKTESFYIEELKPVKGEVYLLAEFKNISGGSISVFLCSSGKVKIKGNK